MKKIILTVVCGLFVLSASAQLVSDGSNFKDSSDKENDKEKVTFGIRAGVNVANFKSLGESWGSQCGYNVGVILDIPAGSRYFYVQPGLFLSQKGCDLAGEKDKPAYLEIPILLSGRFDITDKIQLQVNFGPYFAAGIFGKDALDWNCFGGEGDYKRFDAGLSLGAGFNIAKHFYVGFQYEFGLANINKNSIKIENRNCMIGIGVNY